MRNIFSTLDHASIYDVAQRAGVSPSTVSRVFNAHPHVTPNTRQRVLRYARQLAFTPKKRQTSIALLVANLDLPYTGGYVGALVTAIARHLAARGRLMELVPLEHLDLLWNAQVAGVIGITFDECFLQLRSIPNLKLLSINQPMTAQGIHSVSINHRAQGVQAAEHLIAHGHRKIAFFENQPGNWGSQERLRGMQDALQSHGLPLETDLLCYAAQMPAYEAVNRVRNLGATAIMNFSDLWLLEVTHLVQNILKLRIPQDLSIICSDDYPLLRFLTPPHTVVHQPLDELARVAVNTMLDLLERPASNSSRKNVKAVETQLEPELIARESVANLNGEPTP